MTAVQNLGYISFRWEKGMGSMTASQYIYMYIIQQGPHICGSHSSCQTSARCFWVSFRADDETECYLSFLIDPKHWPWFKKHNCVASVQSSHGRFIACLWRTENVRENWEMDMTMWKWGKEFTTPFHIFFKKNKKTLCLKMVLEMTSSQLVLFIT